MKKTKKIIIISWFINGEQIKLPAAEANNWCVRHSQIAILCDQSITKFLLIFKWLFDRRSAFFLHLRLINISHVQNAICSVTHLGEGVLESRIPLISGLNFPWTPIAKIIGFPTLQALIMWSIPYLIKSPSIFLHSVTYFI